MKRGCKTNYPINYAIILGNTMNCPTIEEAIEGITNLDLSKKQLVEMCKLANVRLRTNSNKDQIIEQYVDATLGASLRSVALRRGAEIPIGVQKIVPEPDYQDILNCLVSNYTYVEDAVYWLNSLKLKKRDLEKLYALASLTPRIGRGTIDFMVIDLVDRIAGAKWRTK